MLIKVFEYGDFVSKKNWIDVNQTSKFQYWMNANNRKKDKRTKINMLIALLFVPFGNFNSLKFMSVYFKKQTKKL